MLIKQQGSRDVLLYEYQTSAIKASMASAEV